MGEARQQCDWSIRKALEVLTGSGMFFRGSGASSPMACFLQWSRAGPNKTRDPAFPDWVAVTAYVHSRLNLVQRNKPFISKMVVFFSSNFSIVKQTGYFPSRSEKLR